MSPRDQGIPTWFSPLREALLFRGVLRVERDRIEVLDEIHGFETDGEQQFHHLHLAIAIRPACAGLDLMLVRPRGKESPLADAWVKLVRERLPASIRAGFSTSIYTA